MNEGAKEEFMVGITNLPSSMDPTCFISPTPLLMNGDKNSWSFNEMILKSQSYQELECQRAHPLSESSHNKGEDTYTCIFVVRTPRGCTMQ